VSRLRLVSKHRTAEVRCTRCGGQRWTMVLKTDPEPTEYVCLRCRAVLAGRNVRDPVVEQARAARHGRRTPASGVRTPDSGAIGRPGDTEIAWPVRTPAERRRAARQRQIEAAGGIEAYRAQERERKQAARRRRSA
jgi:hypothetical protein